MSKKTKKQLTWLDAEKFIKGLTEAQKARPLRWWGDERGDVVVSLIKAKRDYFDSGHGELYTTEGMSKKDIATEYATDTPIVLKGDPIINVD